MKAASSSMTGSLPSVPQPSRVSLVVELVLRLLTESATNKESKAVLLGVPLVMHDLFGPDDDAVLFQAVRGHANQELVLDFVAAWCSTGRLLSPANLDVMHAFVLAQPDSAAKKTCLERVDRAIDSFSPVLGRWRSNISPRSNIFAWLVWDVEQIGAALTSMCLPFFRVRAHEFDEKKPGKHLKDLNLRYNSVSMFVATSVLSAAVVAKKQGIVAMEKWIDVACNLRERRNYHMLFAIQNALEKHQVDRLKFLAKGLSRKHAKAKKEIDSLFSATDRMRLLKAEVATLVGKQPLIPCVFWLVQKSALLQETPVLADGKINTQRIVAATNIFSDLSPMQELKFPPLREDEQVLWYLMRLERESLCSEEDMYKLSDAAKKLGSRFQIGKGGLTKGKLEKQRKASLTVESASPKKGDKRGSETGFFGRRGSETPVPGSADSSPISASRKLNKSDRGDKEQTTTSSDGNSEEEEVDMTVIDTAPLSLEAVMSMATVHVTGKDDKNFLASVATML